MEDLDAALGCDLGGQLDREPVRVMELEGGGSAEGLLGPKIGELGFEKIHARLQGPQETLLLADHNREHHFLLGHQFRKGLAKGGNRRFDEDRGDQFAFGAELPGPTDRPPQHSSEDITAAVVRGDHTIADIRVVMVRAWSARMRSETSPASDATVGNPDPGGGVLADLAQTIGVENRVDPLEHTGGPFEPHAGVDVLGGKVTDHVKGLVLDVLHEDQVPDLDVTILAAADRSAFAPVLLPLS